MDKNIFIKILSLILVVSMILLSSCVPDEVTSSQVSSIVSSGEEVSSVTADAYPEYKSVINPVEGAPVALDFRADDGYFYHNVAGSWNFSYIKGVIVGDTLPDDQSTSNRYATYIDWFEKIRDMNANTVRVKELMTSEFYNALYNYNAENPKKPIYLLQDVVFGEGASASQMLENFKEQSKITVDAVHGGLETEGDGDDYTSNVSSYIAGYIITAEHTPEFIAAFDETVTAEGNYLTVGEGASFYETLLAAAGEELISYESESYAYQIPVAFFTLPESDTLLHSQGEDVGTVNTENIIACERYYAGLFAAVSVYSARPQFMTSQDAYVNYTSPATGLSDPYRAYIKALKNQYTVPVIVAQTGLSTSRNVAYENGSGISMGGLDEETQGEYLADMVKDIAKEAYAGAVIDSWTDDWSADSWNSLNYSESADEPITPDVTSERGNYGILAFDAASGYSDGNITDWMGADPVFENDSYELYTKYDAAYLHIYINVKKEFNFDSDTVFVPISVVDTGSLSAAEYSLEFDSPADYLLVINGKDNTRLMTDAYNDMFLWQYAKDSVGVSADSGVYNKIMTAVSPYSEASAVTRESGLLTFGVNNPNLDDYNSLADFYSSGHKIEIRLAWSMLGVGNAASLKAVGDFNKNGKIAFTSFSDIKIGVGDQEQTIALSTVECRRMNAVSYRQRLKSSYYSLASAFGKIFRKNATK